MYHLHKAKGLYSLNKWWTEINDNVYVNKKHSSCRSFFGVYQDSLSTSFWMLYYHKIKKFRRPKGISNQLKLKKKYLKKGSANNKLLM